MTADPSDADSPDESDRSDGSSRELARVVQQHFRSPASVSEDELREALQTAVEGTVVGLTPGDTEITVVVEQSPSEAGEAARDAYVVRRSTDVDGEPTVEWSYLGPAN